MGSLRTASDVRSYFLKNWRQLVPDLLAPQVKIGLAEQDAALIQIDLPGEGGPVARLLLVPVASGEPRLLRALLPRLRGLGRHGDTWAGLAVPHMGASGQRTCREAGVGFIDCCGNAYLRFNQVVVQIAGNRNKFHAPKRPRTVFNDKATIPLRILLEDPGAWVTTREIAERGGLSLGWASHVLQQLDAEGYVERKRGGGTKLIDPDRLVGDWLRHYTFEHNAVFPFQIREGGAPKALGRLRGLQPPLFDRYALTLEAAVALETNDEPSDLHLYLPDLAADGDRALERWSEALRLRPAGHGANCFLVGPAYAHGAFFGMRRVQGLRLVSDLQLYLDLYHFPVTDGPELRMAVASRLPFSVEELAR